MNESVPPSTSVMVCGMPLYGTSTTSRLPMDLSIASDTCEPAEPYPAESLPGFARASARNSLKSLIGESDLTMSMNEVVPMRATGAKSFTGS